MPLPKVQSKGAAVSAQPTTPEMAMGSPSTVSASLSRTPWPDAVVRTTVGVVFAARSTRSSVLPKPVKLSAPAVGASLTQLTVMVKFTVAEVSTPPLAVPPLSCRLTLTVAVPNAFGAGVNVSTPAAEMEGCAVKSALLLLAAMKCTVCVLSFGPGEMAEAHAAE